MMDFVICLRNCEVLAQKKKPCIIVSLYISVLLQQCITHSQIAVSARPYIFCVSQLFSLTPDIPTNLLNLLKSTGHVMHQQF
jgi:hypothetical protein